MKKYSITAFATGALALSLGITDAEASSSSYTVKSGDTLWKISSKNNVSLIDLKKWNNLTNDSIFPNQTLQLNNSVTTDVSTNKTNTTKTTVTPSSTSSHTYKVVTGDSLSTIAKKHGTTVSKLQQLNNISNHLIYAGQTIKVDASTTSVKPVVITPTSQPAEKTPTVTPSSTYKVKSGDTLSKISLKYGTSVLKLQQLNNITNHTIYVGQTIKVEGTAAVPTPSVQTPTQTKTPSKTETAVTPTSTYRVVAGDTLSHIAHQHGLTVTQIQTWNSLTSSLIRAGQALKIENRTTVPIPDATQVSSPVTQPVAPSSSPKINNLINFAHTFKGVPYVWGGSSPNGFDCSGFIYYVFNKSAGTSLPRTNVVGLDARSYEVSSPQIGDLVFFSNTYKKGVSHVGIYIGNNSFIHAGGDKVQVTSLNNSYWKKHFDSYKRFY